MVTAGSSSAGNVLFGKTRQAVLRLLLTRPDESLHLREVVRLTGAGLGPVQRELAKLVSAGLIRRQQRGRQVFYSAATDAPVFPELRGLVIKTAGVADVLRDALWPLRERIVAALVFGSVARGEQRAGSDVDVLVVSDAVSFAELTSALHPTQQVLGREVNPILYSTHEFATKRASGHHFLRRVLEAEKVVLIGGADELERLGAQRVAPAARSDAKRDRRAV